MHQDLTNDDARDRPRTLPDDLGPDETTGPVAFSIRRAEDLPDRRRRLVEDLRRGLARPPYEVPSMWLYDETGSELFERITAQPAYHIARAELALLDRHGPEIVERASPLEIVDLGSGSGRKLRTLVGPLHLRHPDARVVLVDVSEAAAKAGAANLAAGFPGLRVEAYVGRIEDALRRLPREGPRLTLMLGATYGNLPEDERRRFLESYRVGSAGADRLLLGIDLFRDPTRLRAAYADTEGLAEAFNRNLLRVLRREVGITLPDEAFDYVVEIEDDVVRMALRARRRITAEAPELGRPLVLEPGDEITTAISRRFSPGSVAAELREADLDVDHVWTYEGDLALVLASPASGGGTAG